jgi:hypothetical protein
MLRGEIVATPQQGDGRRLYIHEASFEHLALHGVEAASLIYSALVSAPVVKLAYHDVAEDAVMEGRFSAAKADALKSAVSERWFDALTRALRRIGYRPSDPKRRSAFLPLLNPDESVLAICMDAQYYTFATSEPSARRMYADIIKLSKVRHLISVRDEAYRDLTLIKGKALALIDPNIGTGDHLALRYVPTLEAPGSLPPAELNRIKDEILRRFEDDLSSLIAKTVSAPDPTEAEVLEQFESKCISIVRRVVLRLN